MASNFKAYTEVGKRIAALGKRQKHIARVLGVRQQSVSKKLRGGSAILLSDLEKLSEAYGVPLTFFFEDKPLDPEFAVAVEHIKTDGGPMRDLVVFARQLPPTEQKQLLAIAGTLAR
jgi:transcriptional regulator with XRE-family HTH domain